MKKGMVAITTVLVLGAVVVLIVASVSLLSINQGQMLLAGEKAENSLFLVEGCVEDALMKIHADSGYSGGQITRPEGNCTVTIDSGNPNWEITVSTNDPLYLRKIHIQAIRNQSSIQLLSWQEI